MATRVPKVETLNYRLGGFHPVHLNDSFKNGRYLVIHKLGHGGFATVWLARDTIRLRYVALKILAARLSNDCPEVEVLRRLRNSDDDKNGKAYVMSMLDHFFIDGPNGHHLCVVSQVGGPSIKQFNDCPGFRSGSRRLRGKVARRVAFQATEGLAFIHSVGIVHGDFTAANILLKLANIDAWTVDEIHERLGAPQIEDLHQALGGVHNISGPRYTVKDVTMKHVDPKWLLDQIMIIDFGIAFSQEQSSLDIGTPKAYCAPEFLFGYPRSTASDVWALGCTIFEIRTGSPLFRHRGVPSREQVLMSIVEKLGKLPPLWWDQWEKGRAWYADRMKTDGDLPQTIQGTLLQDIREVGLHDGDPANLPPRRINATFPGSRLVSREHTIFSEQQRNRTSNLVALVEELTTSEAADVIALVNKSSGSSQDISSSGSSSGSGSGSSLLNKHQSASIPGSGGGSGSGGSNARSGTKSISSEGIPSGAAVTPQDKATVAEQNILQPREGSHSPIFAEVLEIKGTTIADEEGYRLEDFLRQALRLLPEERIDSKSLAAHPWFFTESVASTILSVDGADGADPG